MENTYTMTVPVKEGINITITMTHLAGEGDMYDHRSYDYIQWNSTIDLNGEVVKFPINLNFTAARNDNRKYLIEHSGSKEVTKMFEDENVEFVSFFVLDNYKGQKKVQIILKDIDLGTVISRAMDALIDEMHAKGEGLDHLSPNQREKLDLKERILEAKKYVGMVSDPDALVTEEEAKKMRRAYRIVNNEGGEGYIPDFLTKENYEAAKKLLIENDQW